MKRIIIECVQSEFEPMIETLKEEFKNYQIYGWDEVFHFTVTPQELHKAIRVFNACEIHFKKRISFQDMKIVRRLRDMFRNALDEIKGD